MVVPHQAPRIPPVKTESIISRTRIVQKAMYRVHSLQNRRMDFRPLSFLQPIRIKSSNLSLPYPTLVHGYVTYVFQGSVVKWIVTYENPSRIMLPFKYEQELDGVLEEEREILRAKKSMEVSIPYTMTDSKSFIAFATVIFRKRIVDFVQKTFDIGFLKYRLKPVREYPGPDGLNEDLTEIGGVEGLKRSWLDSQKPSGEVRAFHSWSWAGFKPFRDILFRPPDIYPTFFVRWAIRNNLPRTYVKVDILAPMAGVVYEDENHITWVGGSIIKGVSIPPTTTRTLSFSQSIPPWIYGKILLLSSVWTPSRDAYYIRFSEFKVGDMILPR